MEDGLHIRDISRLILTCSLILTVDLMFSSPVWIQLLDETFCYQLMNVYGACIYGRRLQTSLVKYGHADKTAAPENFLFSHTHTKSLETETDSLEVLQLK